MENVFQLSFLCQVKYCNQLSVNKQTKPVGIKVLSKYQGIFKILQWNASLRKTPTLKIAQSSPKNSVFIGHASNPP